MKLAIWLCWGVINNQLVLLSFAAYALVLICALAFVTNLTRCLKFLLLSRNVELTVEQQKLFGVTDFGLCVVLILRFFYADEVRSSD